MARAVEAAAVVEAAADAAAQPEAVAAHADEQSDL